MKSNSPNFTQIALGMVGSTKFGRYPKISVEQTFNMIESDGFLVDYAGYKAVSVISEGANQGRGLFNSTRFNHMIVVIDNGVYIVDAAIAVIKIAAIETFAGDVFIDENDANQIAICDKRNLYIFNYVANTFQQISLDFIPNYISFQDGYFIAAVQGSPNWRLSALNDGTSWPAAPNNIGSFQTKPDNCVAVVRVPGRGGNVLVFGDTVAEAWVDAGLPIFPYQRNNSFNIDYGTLNPATIAFGDKFAIWLGSNEKSGPVIMYSTGGDPKTIENDGINFKLSSLNNPGNSYGFIFKQDGHLFYQLTFPDPDDNFSITFDFNKQAFYTVCDPNQNYFIAKRVVFFNDGYYFVSFNDGKLYKLGTEFTDYDGELIPRMRVCPTLRLPGTRPFIANNLSFIVEQGNADTDYRIDVSISRDGGVNFGNPAGYPLNAIGNRSNIFQIWNLGYANEFTPQFRFWSSDRFVVGEGEVSIYQ